ncbi:hypothetical protein MNBD_GAMMA11-1398 [hydrothermal vent metagenome]|uniref:Uncharacterized protein n=1 Tax=hydrothermal vent metagenome TaxID=652676 RepID=A0A3B0WQM5_9ZZZZ
MAFYVEIKKTSEDSVYVVYKFTGDGGSSGEFKINKNSGEVTLIKKMEGINSDKALQRATVKIRKEWKSGVLPDLTEWAS